MYDEHGPVGLHPHDRRYGWMLLGSAGTGKTAALGPHVKAIGADPSRAAIIIDPKEDFAKVCMGLIPAGRVVHYLDLGAPRYGLNILKAGQLSPELRADILIAAIRELSGDSAVGPRSDLFLRAAIQAVAIVETAPALQHVAALLDPFDKGYRGWVARELRLHHEVDWCREYWNTTFPRMAKENPRFVAEAVAAPENKVARFLNSPSLNLLMTHPIQLNLEQIIKRREVLIVNGAKGAIGEDNANLFCAMLILLAQRALQQMQRLPPDERTQTALVIDEAHNVFIRAFAMLLSEGRSAGVEVVAAFQYTGQIEDERVKKGIRSLLQNVSVFRQREFEDARSAAALAMEVFQDTIRGDIEDQRRLRIDPIDVVQRQDYSAVNLWLAHGVPQPAATASTAPLELIADTSEAHQAREHHYAAQLRRGDHPHDHGRYIHPPLVRSIAHPIVAVFRTVHVDLPGWSHCPPIEQLSRVVIVLRPKGGDPAAFVAAAIDSSGRRYAAELPSDRTEPGWIDAGTYVVEVMVWTADESLPKRWAPNVEQRGAGEAPLALNIQDEPLRAAERRAA
jgi:Type IV secretion-system coupling protein DNA-binding domain